MAVFNMVPPARGGGPTMGGGPVQGGKQQSYSQLSAQRPRTEAKPVQKPPYQQFGGPQADPPQITPVQKPGYSGMPSYSTQPVSNVQAYNQGAPAVMPPQQQMGSMQLMNRLNGQAPVNGQRKPGQQMMPPQPAAQQQSALMDALRNRFQTQNSVQNVRPNFFGY